MKRICIFILLVGGISLLQAQSDSLNVYWTPNTEPDMLKYLLQRSVNSGAFIDNQFINHPLAHAVDHDIQPGNLYSYRLAAIDSAGNQSGFSAVVSAGIPEVILTSLSIFSNVTTTQDLNALVQDPDDNVSALNVQISSANNITVSRQGNSLSLTPSPLSYVGSASFQLTVTDGMGFFDTKLVTVNIQNQQTGGTNTPPHIVGLSQIASAEDSVFTISLNSFVQDSTDNPQDLTWTIQPNGFIQVEYDRTANTAQFIPDKDWFGDTSIDFKVTDPAGAFDEKVVPVTLAPRIDLLSFSVAGLPEGGARAAWATDMPTITILQYWTDPAAKKSVTSSSTPQKNHEVTLTDVQENVVYHFRLTSQDTSRRFAVLADSTFEFSGNGPAARKQIIVYPNPVKVASGNDRVYFDNLPGDVSNLILYNIFGEQIYSTPMVSQSGGRFSLALVNNSKLKLGSGYYIYLIKNQKDKVIKRGKIVLIR